MSKALSKYVIAFINLSFLVQDKKMEILTLSKLNTESFN